MAKKRSPLYGTPRQISIPSGNVPNPTNATANEGDSIVFTNTDTSTKIVRYAADKQASKYHPFCLIIPPGAQIEVLAEPSSGKAKKDIVYYSVDTIDDLGKIRRKRKKRKKGKLELDDTYQVIVNS